MTKVFISYSRKDKAFAEKLKEALETIGLEAWIDWIDIPPVADWWDQIQKGIEDSDAFLFLLSPYSISSKVCGQEVDHAVKNGKRLIPLVVRDGNETDVHPALTKLNWIFFRDQDNFDTSLKKLELGIKTDLAWVEFHRRLQVRGVEWEKHKDNSLLLRGKDLRQAEEQLSTAGQKDPQPTDLQRQYVLESRRRESQTRNGVLMVGAIVMVALAALSVIAISQRNDATNQRNIANSNAVTAIANQHVAQTAQANAVEQLSISRAGELSAQAVSVRDTQFDLSLLLSVEAFRETDTVQSRSVLLDNSQTNPNLLQYLHGHNGWVNHISFSPDGKIFMSGSADGTIIFWDSTTRQTIGKLFLENAGPISNMILSPNGKTLVSAYSDGKIVFWDVATRQALGQPISLAESSNFVSSLDFSPDGKILALGTKNGPILLWDVASRQAVGKPLAGNTGSVSSLDFSPDGRTLVSGNQDGSIILWDIKTHQPGSPPLTGYSDFVIDIAFNPNGKTFLSSSESGSTILWDTTTRQPIEQLFWESPDRQKYSIFDFSPDGKLVAFLQCQTIDKEGFCIQSEVVLWNVESRQFIDHPLQGFVYESHSLAFSPDGKTIAAGSCEKMEAQRICSKGNIILWDLEILHPIGQLFEQKRQSNSHTIALSPDGNTLASGNFGDSIDLWDIATQHLIDQIVPKANHSLSSLTFSPDGKTLVVAYDNSSVILWNLTTRQSHDLLLTENSDKIDSVSFSPNGNILAAVSSEGRIILWDLIASQPIDWTFSTNSGQITNIDFSPDGGLLAAGNSDGSIFLWDLNTRSMISQPLQTQTRLLYNVVTFSPDGKILAAGYTAGTMEGAIVLWDLTTKRPIGQPITGDEGWYRVGQISSLDFSPDGKFIVSASRTDGQLILWDMDPLSWIEKACIRSGRNLSRTEWAQYFPNEQYRATCAQWPLEKEIPVSP